MSAFGQISIGIAMLALTVATAATFIVVGAQVLYWKHDAIRRRQSMLVQVLALTGVTVWLAMGLLVGMACWATLLFSMGVFSDFIEALYFSMVAFTTLGFGDITLPPEWWLLSGFISTDGFIIFGLDTAFLFEALRRLTEEAVANEPDPFASRE